MSETRWRGISTLSTFTRTTSPAFTTVRGSVTKFRDIADTCTRPSWCTPTSTKAPNAATLLTTPSSTMPGARSSSVSTPSANEAVVNAGRGSRPGFSSSRRMSVTVGSPKRSSVKSGGRRERSTAVLPISSPAVIAAVFRMRTTTG